MYLHKALWQAKVEKMTSQIVDNYFHAWKFPDSVCMINV